eukprot:Pgem_evm1s10901
MDRSIMRATNKDQIRRILSVELGSNYVEGDVTTGVKDRCIEYVGYYKFVPFLEKSVEDKEAEKNNTIILNLSWSQAIPKHRKLLDEFKTKYREMKNISDDTKISVRFKYPTAKIVHI